MTALSSFSCRMRALAVSAISLIAFSAAAPMASALPVTVNGIDYDVSMQVTQYDNNITLLENQVWWGNQTLAEQFAGAVNNQLGTPNFNHYSAFFAASVTGVLTNALWSDGVLLAAGVQPFDVNPAGTYWFATATTTAAPAVPESASTFAILLLSMSALGFVARRRR